MLKIILILLFSPIMIFSQISSWQIWAISNTSIFQKNSRDTIGIGITGFGKLKPSDVKMIIHTTPDIRIRSIDMSPDSTFDTICLPFNKTSPETLFTEPIRRGDNKLYLKTDIYPLFNKIIITSTFSGDKYIDLYLTYSPDGKNWYTTMKKYEFHVNSFYDNNKTTLALFAFLFGLSALISNSISIYKSIKNRKKEHRNSKIKKKK